MKPSNFNNCIYKLTSPKGKIYFGQTTDFNRRMKQYKNKSSCGTYIKNAIIKYGWDNFKKQVLIYNLTKDEMNDFEILLIKEFKSQDKNIGYNNAAGGEEITPRKFLEFEKEICKQYLSGISSHELGKIYKCSKSTILNILKYNNICKRKGGGKPNISRIKRRKLNQKQEHLICKDYQNGIGSYILGKKYKVTKKTILTILKRNNISTRKRAE